MVNFGVHSFLEKDIAPVEQNDGVCHEGSVGGKKGLAEWIAVLFEKKIEEVTHGCPDRQGHGLLRHPHEVTNETKVKYLNAHNITGSAMTLGSLEVSLFRFTL